MIAAKRREKKKWLCHRNFLFTSKNDKFVEQEKLHLKVEYMLRYIK
jgi:hypothetical protein